VNDLKDEPFALIGVHVGGSNVAELKVVMERENLPWRSFVDPGQAAAGPIATSWNSPSTPTFFVLDAQGVIRHRWLGKADPKVVDAALRKLIREAKEAAGSGK
jgi:peroxiredoxin